MKPSQHPSPCVVGWGLRVSRLDEGIPVLYQSNVFFIINAGSRRRPADDIRSLQAKMPKNWPLLRSLEIKWEVAAFDRNHANMVPHIWGREGYEALWDALAEMPALTQLRIALMLPRYSSPSGITSTAELRTLYFGPISRLTNVRFCEVILPRSYCPPLGMHEGDSCLESDGHTQFQISWANEDDERPLSAEVAATYHILPAFVSSHRRPLELRDEAARDSTLEPPSAG